MITGRLQNKYICISNISKSKIKDLTRISHVLIEIFKNTALQNYVRLLVGRSIFGQHWAVTLCTTNVRKKQRFNINSKDNKRYICISNRSVSKTKKI